MHASVNDCFMMLVAFLCVGFIELVPSQAVAEIIQENDGSILNYLKKQAPGDTPQGISQDVMDNYIRSCGMLISLPPLYPI